MSTSCCELNIDEFLCTGCHLGVDESFCSSCLQIFSDLFCCCLPIWTSISEKFAGSRQAPETEKVPHDACTADKQIMTDDILSRARGLMSDLDVTLDPETAHPNLVLSDDGKQVYHSIERKDLPDNPERFCDGTCVLAKQSISSGIFYFEVQVKDKEHWTLGVAAESMKRKGGIALMPPFNWTIRLTKEYGYGALDSPCVSLSLQSRPERVGVFVNYDEGLVTFFDVDTRALIYSYTGRTFTEKLYPFFCPGSNLSGTNAAPLIIS